MKPPCHPRAGMHRASRVAHEKPISRKRTNSVQRDRFIDGAPAPPAPPPRHARARVCLFLRTLTEIRPLPITAADIALVRSTERIENSAQGAFQRICLSAEISRRIAGRGQCRGSALTSSRFPAFEASSRNGSGIMGSRETGMRL